MLTKLIVDLYTWVIEIFLWLILLIAVIAGYHLTIPMLNSAGWILENETPWKLLGAVLSPVATLLILAFLVGPILVLLDIRRSVKALAMRNSGSGSGALSVRRKDPSL